MNPSNAAENAVVHTSRFSYSETIDRLAAAIRTAGATLFAQIDQSDAAAGVGLSLRPTTLLIYGTAVAAGRVDAADLAEPFLSASQNTRVLGQFSDAIAPQWVEGAYFCTADFAKAHPDIVKKFADAIGEASDWANTHRAESAAILERYSKATVLPTTHRALYHDTLRASDLQPVIDIAAKYGLIKKSFPAQELFAQDVR